jgi:predicted metal-dependent enzyme (double-stranded beta helix superfamily)
MTIQTRRDAAVAAALDEVGKIEAGHGITRESLALITKTLQRLAEHKDLFGFDEFPPPPADGKDTSKRYRINGDDPRGYALYLNAIIPGKTTIPHNHDTWAAIVACEGEELNRLYRRTDDRSDPDNAKIVLDREVTVKPGTPISFLADDLHSIHVSGPNPTLHFHLYGRPLDTLSGRIGIEPDTGRIVKYNAVHMNSTVQPVG